MSNRPAWSFDRSRSTAVGGMVVSRSHQVKAVGRWPSPTRSASSSVSSREHPIAKLRLMARLGPSHRADLRREGPFFRRSSQIEAIRVHHLRPGGNEVVYKLLLVVILGIDLGIGAQHGVGAENQIDAGCGPFDCTGLAITDFVQILACRHPCIVHVCQVDEEIRG